MKKPKIQSKTTLSELARQLGISRQLLNIHRKNPDAPKDFNAESWQQFLAAVGREGSSPSEVRQAIAQARLRCLQLNAEKQALENSRTKGQLMPVADARRQCAEAWSFLFGEFERWQNELPPQLAGLDAVQAYKVLHAAIERLRRDAKDRFEKVGGEQ